LSVKPGEESDETEESKVKSFYYSIDLSENEISYIEDNAFDFENPKKLFLIIGTKKLTFQGFYQKSIHFSACTSLTPVGSQMLTRLQNTLKQPEVICLSKRIEPGGNAPRVVVDCN